MATDRFFDDDGMDFATRCVLGGVRHGMAEPGEVLQATSTIIDGDPESWLDTYLALGRRLHVDALDATERGHRHSAWNAALRAANYLYAATWWAPSTLWADKVDELWEEHRSSWDLAVRNWPSEVWPVRIPHRDVTLAGFWFRSPAAGDTPAPTLVLLQGFGTPISDSTMTGLDGALARGHHVLVFDGPGQGVALRRDALSLQYGWDGVVTSALDWLETRPDADDASVSLLGVGHGALLAASGAADPRVSALVVSPGVVDLGASARAEVDAAATDSQRAQLEWTVTGPCGTGSVDAALALLDTYRLEDAQLGAVAAPTLVVRGEDAVGFTNQSRALVRALGGTAEEVVLRSNDGAGADCGIGASQVHDAVVFDWLDERTRTRPGCGTGHRIDHRADRRAAPRADRRPHRRTTRSGDAP